MSTDPCIRPWPGDPSVPLHSRISDQLRAAKAHLFAVLELGLEVDDPELRRLLYATRNWLEGADRRIDKLAEAGKLEAPARRIRAALLNLHASGDELEALLGARRQARAAEESGGRKVLAETAFQLDGLDGVARARADKTLEVELDDGKGGGLKPNATGQWVDGFSVATLVDVEWGEEVYRDECPRFFAAVESALRAEFERIELERPGVAQTLALREAIEENEKLRQLMQAALMWLDDVPGAESLCERIAAFGGARFATDHDTPDDGECNNPNATSKARPSGY